MRRKRYFQWLDGDLEGTVEVLKTIEYIEGEYFYKFESGEVCNVKFISPMTRDPRSLKGKVMVEIMNPSDKWKTKTITTHTYKYMDPTAGEQIVEYPPLEDITGATGTGNNLSVNESNIGKKKYYPPQYKGPYQPLPSYEDYAEDEYYEPVNNAASVITKEREVPAATKKVEEARIPQPVLDNTSIQYSQPVKQNTVVDNDPVYILAKTSKKHDTEIELTLNINLPSKAIFALAQSEFENGGQKFVNYLVNEIDPQIILSALKVALLDSYTTE